MADEYLIQAETLEGIADAIRTKRGTTDKIPVPNMRPEILAISEGGDSSGEIGYAAGSYNGTWTSGSYMTAGSYQSVSIPLGSVSFVPDYVVLYDVYGDEEPNNRLNAYPESGLPVQEAYIYDYILGCTPQYFGRYSGKMCVVVSGSILSTYVEFEPDQSGAIPSFSIEDGVLYITLKFMNNTGSTLQSKTLDLNFSWAVGKRR